jgi:type II secretory pathway component PulF
VNFTLLGALRRVEHLRQRSEFYRSWETAIRAQRDVALSVQHMDEPLSAELRAARAYLAEGVAKGRPVGVIVKLRPDLFPVLDQTVIAAGDSFGILHDSCRLLSEYYVRDHERMARVRGWLAIPIVAWFAATFIVPFPLVWDQGTLAYSAAIITSVAAFFLVGGVPASLLYSLAGATDRIRRPRFAWALAIGLEGGLTFAGAARLAATVSGMDAVGRRLDAMAPRELKAMTLSQMLDAAGVWPEMVLQARKADEASEYISTLRVFAAALEVPA